MDPKKLIECPAYIITDARNGSIAAISSEGTDWFPVFHTLELAEQHAKQSGSQFATRTVADSAEFREILKANSQIAGFFVNNGASPEFFSRVNRQDLLGE